MNKKLQEEVFLPNKADLINWLEKNYIQKESVWLNYYKPSLKKGDLDWKTIVDILLRYGWIDSQPRKIEDGKTSIRISPRNPKSNWSRINKEKISNLIENNLMHPQGLAMVELAKKNGTWDALNEVESLILPTDLENALKEANLIDAWNNKSKSWKRGQLEILLNAKRQETRSKRISSIINLLL